MQFHCGCGYVPTVNEKGIRAYSRKIIWAAVVAQIIFPA